jgi:hypothetical protein
MIKTILILLGCVAFFCWTGKHFHTEDGGSNDFYAHAFCGYTYGLVLSHYGTPASEIRPGQPANRWIVSFVVIDHDVLPNWEKEPHFGTP